MKTNNLYKIERTAEGNLADRLDALQRGQLGPEDGGWDIG